MSDIFDITLEDGDLGEFDSTTTDSGDLSAHEDAAIFGTYGLQAVLDDTNVLSAIKYVSATGQDVFRWRVYFDPNSVSMPEGSSFYFQRLRSAGFATDFLVCYFHYSAANGYRANIYLRDDDNANPFNHYSPTISDGVHYLEFQVTKATNATSDDGTLRWWIDGSEETGFTEWDNFNLFDDATAYWFYCCAISVDTDTSGAVYFDNFKANDDGSEIGPVAETDPEDTEQLQTVDKSVLTQAQLLGKTDAEQLQTVGVSTATVLYSLTVTSISQLQTVGKSTTTQAQSLTSVSIEQLQTSGKATPTQAQNLTVDEIAQLQAVGVPMPTQSQLVTPLDIVQAQTLAICTIIYISGSGAILPLQSSPLDTLKSKELVTAYSDGETIKSKVR